MGDSAATESPTQWTNTTHDWAASVDREHLAQVREHPATYAPGGIRHLILEVLAYAADEAGSAGRVGRVGRAGRAGRVGRAGRAGRAGRGIVTLHQDGSVSVADDGRGTDTRVTDTGRVIKKPVMGTKDLRFFDDADAERLPDGHPRRGISVVAALSEWLIHTNRRASGSWTQRYERGVPTTDLTPVPDDGTTGTRVHFTPDLTIVAGPRLTAHKLALAADWPQLRVEVVDERVVDERPG